MRVASVKLEAANWSRKWGKVGFRVFLYAGKFLIGIHFVAARLESLSLRKGFSSVMISRFSPREGREGDRARSHCGPIR